jgi:hypothetical protein
LQLLERIWQLAAGLTAYAAAYVALAEALDAPLVTTDGARAVVGPRRRDHLLHGLGHRRSRKSRRARTGILLESFQ